jgi:hypothetical protein
MRGVSHGCRRYSQGQRARANQLRELPWAAGSACCGSGRCCAAARPARDVRRVSPAQRGETSRLQDRQLCRACRSGRLHDVSSGTCAETAIGAAMPPDRRTFLLQTGKLLVLTASAAAAWDYVVAGQAENSPDYDVTAHWWAMINRRRKVHWLRSLRSRLQGGKRCPPRAAVLPHVGGTVRNRPCRSGPSSRRVAERRLRRIRGKLKAGSKDVLRPEAVRPLHGFPVRPGLPGWCHLPDT